MPRYFVPVRAAGVWEGPARGSEKAHNFSSHAHAKHCKLILEQLVADRYTYNYVCN